MSPEVEDIYAKFPEGRREELVELHKKNAFAEKSKVTGLNKYFPDEAHRTRRGTRKRSIDVEQGINQREKVKKLKGASATGGRKKGRLPANGGKIPTTVKRRLNKLIEELSMASNLVKTTITRYNSMAEKPVPEKMWKEYNTRGLELDVSLSQYELYANEDYNCVDLQSVKEEIIHGFELLKLHEKLSEPIDRIFEALTAAGVTWPEVADQDKKSSATGDET